MTAAALPLPHHLPPSRSPVRVSIHLLPPFPTLTSGLCPDIFLISLLRQPPPRPPASGLLPLPSSKSLALGRGLTTLPSPKSWVAPGA